MPNQSLTIYLSRDLAERVEEAKAAGTIDPKTVVKAALEASLNGGSIDPESRQHPANAELVRLSDFLAQPDVSTLWRDEEGSPVDIALRIIERAAYPPIEVDPHPMENQPEGSTTAYEVVWCDNEQELQARLDAISDAHGWPISVAFNSRNRICLLVGWDLDAKQDDG